MNDQAGRNASRTLAVITRAVRPSRWRHVVRVTAPQHFVRFAVRIRAVERSHRLAAAPTRRRRSRVNGTNGDDVGHDILTGEGNWWRWSG